MSPSSVAANFNFAPIGARRQIFQRARARAREDINDQLADFRGKRTAGLGAMFGPKDSELEEARHDKAREGRIVEEVLVKLLETVHQS